MSTLSGNIFRKAKQLLRDKPALEMTEEELEVVNIATLPLLILPQFNETLIDDGLEWLAQVYDEANPAPPMPKITVSKESIPLLAGRR